MRTIGKITKEEEKKHWKKQVQDANNFKLKNVGIPTTSITNFK